MFEAVLLLGIGRLVTSQAQPTRTAEVKLLQQRAILLNGISQALSDPNKAASDSVIIASIIVGYDDVSIIFI
jgi:hypothetical protein